MDRIDSFHEGDIVAFKIDVDNLTESSDEYKYCVIGKTENKVSVSRRGDVKDVSPHELLTKEEVKQAEKEAKDAVNNFLKG
jgi:hypothetical protein